MRLTPTQIQTIQSCVKSNLGEDARVRVFGSRLNDSRRGGDLDLLIDVAEQPAVLARARLKQQLETRLGIPVDVLLTTRDTTPSAFVRLAMAQGQYL